MTTLSKLQAQQRVDQIAAFGRELQNLAQDKVLVLDAEQSTRINGYHQQLMAELASHFDIDRDSQSRQLSMGLRISSFLGALALAASVFFLFRQFWGLFSTAAQTTVLIGASLGSLGLTALVASRDASGYFTKLAALLAFTCFVINISLLGQIYNITPSDTALLPWAALALLLAYFCHLRLLLVAGLLCLIAYVAARVGTWGGMYWLDMGRRPENFLPLALLMFWLPSWLPHHRYDGFAGTYRIVGLLTLLLPMLLLANWGRSSYLPWSSSSVEGFYQILGFVFSAAAIWLGTRRGWTGTVNTGVVMFVIFLYTKVFDWWWDVMPKYLFFMVIALMAILLMLVFQRLRAMTSSARAGDQP